MLPDAGFIHNVSFCVSFWVSMFHVQALTFLHEKPCKTDCAAVVAIDVILLFLAKWEIYACREFGFLLWSMNELFFEN